MRQFWKPLLFVTVIMFSLAAANADESVPHKVLIRDVTSVEGVRNNSLVGYGLVVGLKGTGDKQQTYFTIQTLASILQRMGVEIPPAVLQTTVQVKNVAAVFVTASPQPCWLRFTTSSVLCRSSCNNRVFSMAMAA